MSPLCLMETCFPGVAGHLPIGNYELIPLSGFACEHPLLYLLSFTYWAQPMSLLTFTSMILSLNLTGPVTEWLCGPGVKYWHKLMACSSPTPQIPRSLKCSYFNTYSSDILIFCACALVIRIAFAPLLYLFLYSIWKFAWLAQSTGMVCLRLF